MIKKIIADAVSIRQQNVKVNIGSIDREFTVNRNDGISTANEDTVNVQTLQRCLTDKFDREMGKTLGTVEDRIQNTILTAIDNLITPRIELTLRSINASSEQDAASVTVNSECGKHTGIITSFENVSDRNNAFHETNANNETGNIPDWASGLLVP